MHYRTLSGLSLFFGVSLAIGCSHAWDELEPLSSGSGGGSVSSGSSSAAGAGGHGPSASSGASSSTAESSSSGGVVMSPLTVTASVAACINPILPDTGDCEGSAGLGQLEVDKFDPYDGFIRFDLDSTLSGKTVDAVTLKLTVTTALSASSSHSGEIWRVSSFTYSSLNATTPTKVGAAPIGVDQGAVTQSQVVQWSLPKDVVVPGSSVFLGVYPLADDNVNYWNTKGAAPPQLVIQFH